MARSMLLALTTLLSAACVVPAAHGAALRNSGRQQQQQTEESQQEQQRQRQLLVQYATNHHCPDPLPTLHGRFTDIKIQEEYHQFYDAVQEVYNEKWRPGTLIEKNLLSAPLPEADFVLWGGAPGFKILMSAFNADTHLEITAKRGITFVDPKSQLPSNDLSHMEGEMTLEGDHVAFVIDYHSTFAHIVIDMLPTIAYLKETIPATTRLLMVNSRNKTRPILEQLDFEFSKRIDWIDCDGKCKNQLVHIRNGSLTVVHPQSSTRHMDLLDHARRWIMQAHPPKQESLNQRTVVYYTRNDASAGHGRGMDVEQEEIMIQLIRDTLQKYKRPEKLVIFDGSLPFDQQIDMFQSASFVIGAHGGGLANMLFLLPNARCDKRPVVLEFLNNPLTPEVQDGSFGRSYYNIYSTCPWVDYHHVLYDSSSKGDVTFVKMEEYKDALQVIFEPRAVLKE